MSYNLCMSSRFILCIAVFLLFFKVFSLSLFFSFFLFCLLFVCFLFDPLKSVIQKMTGFCSANHNPSQVRSFKNQNVLFSTISMFLLLSRTAYVLMCHQWMFFVHDHKMCLCYGLCMRIIYFCQNKEFLTCAVATLSASIFLL